MEAIELPLPFALASVNCWLFEGARPLLVDCGLRREEDLTLLRSALRRADVAQADLQVLLTHGHMDHAGNAAALARAGAKILAHPSEAPHLLTFVRDSRSRNLRFAEALWTHGLPAALVHRVHQRAASVDAYHEDVAIDVPLRVDHRVVAGDQDARVHATPGHTPGSIVVEVGSHLITGDTLLERITSNAIELADEDHGRFHQYLRTLESMRRFVGLIALPGHRRPFEITDALIDDHLSRHGRRQRHVHALLSRPMTAFQILPKVLPHLAKDALFLGMAEVVGHLHALELDGKVRRVIGDVRRFEAV